MTFAATLLLALTILLCLPLTRLLREGHGIIACICFGAAMLTACGAGVLFSVALT